MATIRLGTRFHVTVGKGKYDAVLSLYQNGKAGLFNLPIHSILWDKPIAEFNMPPIRKFGNGETGVEEDDIKSYVASTRFGGLHPEKVPDVILEAY